MIDVLDISNHQGSPSSGYRSLPVYRYAAGLIAQAIPRPVPDGYVGEQLRAGAEDGKKLSIYTWLHHTPSWRLGNQTVEDDQRIRLATVPDDVQLHMRPWLDVEDNQSSEWNQVSVGQRISDVNEALAVLDEWASDRGLPEAGIYWSKYFIDLLFNGTDYWPERKQWWAHYTNDQGFPVPGSLIGGKVVGHQWASLPLDQSKFLESEVIGLPDPTPDCSELQAKVDGLVNALGWMGGDRMKPLLRSSAGKYVKDYVAEMRRVCDQQGVQHS